MNKSKSGFTTSHNFTTVAFSGQRHLLPVIARLALV